MSLPPVFAASALYDSLLQAALRQFFGRATFDTEPTPSLSSDGRLAIFEAPDACERTAQKMGPPECRHDDRNQPRTVLHRGASQADGSAAT